jgi:hypothetical protein
LAAALGGAADSDLLNLVPPEAKVIVGVNVEQTRNSTFGRRLLSEMDRDPSLEKFVSATGFDPRRDLREILLASPSASKTGGKGLVLCRGQFDPGRIRAIADVTGGSTTTYEGVEVAVSREQAGRALWIAILDRSMAVAGDPDSVRSALGRRRSASRMAAALAAKAADLGTRNDIWVLSEGALPEIAGSLPQSPAGRIGPEILNAIQQTSAGIKFGSTVLISGEAVTRSPQDATALADVLRFVAGMVQLNRDKQGAAELATVLDTLDLKAEANTMRFSLSVPEEQFQQFLDPARRQRRTVRL